MKNFSDNLLDLSPFSKSLGVQLEKLKDGHCQCILEVKDHLLNRNGAAHGGVIYSLADISMGGALYSSLEKEERCATIEVKINYLKPAPAGKLTCDSRVIQKGKTIAVLESEIKVDDKLIAKAMGTFAIFKPNS